MDKLKFMQWANKLSETELRNMAVSALRNAPSDLQFDNVGREAEGIKLSGDKQRLAPNGKPSNLNAMQHAQVRTPEFKKWFGDWEALAKQNEIDAFIDKALLDKDPRGSIVLRDVTESERNEVLRQGGPDIIGMQHILDAQEIHHAEKRHGGAGEKSQQPDQRPLTTDDLKRIAVVLDGYDAIKVQTRVHNKTSLIYSKQFSDGKIEYVERVLETSEKHKPRLVTKTVWVKVTTGVKPSPTQVYTPDHKSNLPFKNGRVNPDTVSKVVDENGEPLVVYHTRQKGNNFTEFKNGTAGLIWFANSKKGSGMAALGEGDLVEAYLNAKSPFNTKATAVHFGRIPGTEFNEDLGRITSVLEKTGDDLIYVEDESGIAYAVQNANQIKSATENNGDFSQSNNNIKFSRSTPSNTPADNSAIGILWKNTGIMYLKVIVVRLQLHIRISRI